MNLREAIRAKMVERHGELAVLLGEEMRQLQNSGIIATEARGYWYLYGESDPDKEIGTVFVGDDKMIRWHFYYGLDKHGLAANIPDFITGFVADLYEFIK